MTVFVQLSKHQRKVYDRMERIARNAAQHAKQFPSQQDRYEAQKALEAEVQSLAAQQARDAAQTATPIEVVRTNNALKAQEKYKGLTIRRAIDAVIEGNTP